jgi:2-polyprenyl-6-methoxyphenol hydroxylase-like FAD-dependent oxidoreductase
MGDRQRLFTMPFRPAQLNPDGSIAQPPLTMWQLSYSEEDESCARALKNAPPAELLTSALKRTSDWMEPVNALLSATPLANVWSTPLYDRDARRLRTKQQASRITVAGDAAHPMSMFKGQGANQALQDGPLLAKMLTVVDKNTPKSAVDSYGRPILSRDALLNRIRRYESQMVQRAHSRVIASRSAAAALHSHSAADIGGMYGIGGVALSDEQIRLVLEKCKEQHVGAHLNQQLDDIFANVLNETVPLKQRDSTRKPTREEM